ncbi:electron transfer flavoprotein [Leptobacterium flavescens]|uniref:Electron transfer flavoprotein n=1 Tax=Leptobacterium flavescens TaxID=472055 RepID=A0A6P0URU4_9FLAO|nr:DM13 domain-containing protein [Leptobacterium flavescens]NER14509.1 electron transfer flavoprotein [Leptobacterium flavescens]
MTKLFKYSALVFLMLFLSQGAFSQSLKKGKWDKQNKSISGSWEITKKSDGTYIVLSDDFKTKKAPDLKLFLSKKQASSVNGKNATKDAVFVAKLKSPKGGQSYKIPSNINIDDYTSLLIHCEKYSIFWGGGNL